MGEQGDDTVTDQASDQASDQATDPSAGRKRKPKTRDREQWIERGVAIRAGFYIFGTHLLAGFVWLLFYLGEHAQK
ncbi:DUF6126 family protein [Streptomyces sp. NPDC002514]|uniref:DUF6126 family protein n=1 Tax=unclassified Streptomyces TaxID=2593676 RepID=UPI0036C5D3E8